MPGELFSLSSIRSEVSARQVCEIWGCELSSSCQKFEFEVEDDYMVHLLGLWTICLGDTEDEIHVIAVENEQTQGQSVTIATLQPSLLPMINIHGFEIAPPVTFLLTSGSGPVYISGQHVMLDDNCYFSREEESHLSRLQINTVTCKNYIATSYVPPGINLWSILILWMMAASVLGEVHYTQ